MIWSWCPGPDSNRHALRRGILSPLRLPISPPGLGGQARGSACGADYHTQPVRGSLRAATMHTMPSLQDPRRRHRRDAAGATAAPAAAPANAQRGNVILGKLEGNNPAGSVKDRPAMSMIQRAEERGDIKPGDVLIEATSGNTGIALAMAAAIRGYRMVLIMPEDLSIERAQTMKAFGAELVLTPRSGGMEYARDLALQMQADGKGRVLDQFANADNPRIHYETTGPEIWARHRGPHHAFRQRDGHHRHDHRRVALPEGEEPGGAHRRRAAQRGLAHSGHPQVGRGLSAEDLRPDACRRDRPGEPGRCRRHGAAAGARGRLVRRHLGGGRLLRGAAGWPSGWRTRPSSSSSATVATATCRPACFRHECRVSVLPELRRRRWPRSSSRKTVVRSRGCAAPAAASRTGTTRPPCWPRWSSAPTAAAGCCWRAMRPGPAGALR